MRPIIPFLAPLWAALTEPAYALMRLTAGAFLVPHGLWKLFGITGSQEEMLAFFQARDVGAAGHPAGAAP